MEAFSDKSFEEDELGEPGAPMLEILSDKLYSEPHEVLREYLSNSVDAEAKRVDISCAGPHFDTLIIKDDGKGIANLEELKNALAIMYGKEVDEETKKYRPPIGKFGIGFYSGGLVCTVIEIRSTAKKSNKLIIAKIPIAKWLQQASLKSAARKKMSEVTRFQRRVIEDSKYTNQHFTIVILHKLNEETRKKMKKPALRNQILENLNRIVPVDYDPEMELAQTNFILDNPNELEEVDITYEFKNWLKMLMERKLAQNNIAFGCRYNNTRVFFNGTELFRPHPFKSKYDEPLASEDYWFDEEFKVTGETGKKKLVGIGWAVMRGPRYKKNPKNPNDLVEGGGNFYTECIRGIQIRLFNVEIVPPDAIWVNYTSKKKRTSQPQNHLWGEIYLFDEDIEITPKRDDFLRKGMTDEILKQISKFLERVLSGAENSRKDIRYWKETLQKFSEIQDKIKDFTEKISNFIKESIKSIKQDNDFNSILKKINDNTQEIKNKFKKPIQDINKKIKGFKSSPNLEIHVKTTFDDLKSEILEYQERVKNLLSYLKIRVEEIDRNNKSKAQKITPTLMLESVNSLESSTEASEIEKKSAKLTSEVNQIEVKNKVSNNSISDIQKSVQSTHIEQEKGIEKKSDKVEKVKQNQVLSEEIDEWQQSKEELLKLCNKNNLANRILKEFFLVIESHIDNDEIRKKILENIETIIKENE